MFVPTLGQYHWYRRGPSKAKRTKAARTLKLPPEAVQDACQRVSRGEPLKALAADLGVSVSYLGRKLNAAERLGANAPYCSTLKDIREREMRK